MTSQSEDSLAEISLFFDELLEAQCEQFWKLKTPWEPCPGEAPFFEIYLWESNQVLTENN